MKTGSFRRCLSLLLSAALLLSVFSVVVFALPVKNDAPVIFIAGFASTPTVDLISGDRMFPPSYDD